MTSSQIRLFIFGFIIVLTSLFSFKLSAKALTLNDGTEVPELPTNNRTDYYLIAQGEDNLTYLFFYQQAQIKTIYGNSPSYIQDGYNISDPPSTGAKQGYNAVGGYCGSGDQPKVYAYYLSDNVWKYKGYDCYGANIPLITKYDTSLIIPPGVSNEQFIADNIDQDFVKDYYKHYIKYSNVYFYKILTKYYSDKYYLIYSPEYNTSESTIEYKYRTSFSSASIEDLYSINFGVQSGLGYQNSKKIHFRLQFGANDKDINNIPVLENIQAHVTDINSYLIDKYNFNDYFKLTYKCYKYFEGDSEKTCDGTVELINDSLPSIYGFQLNFLFSNLNNYYIHVFDDSHSNFYWNELQTFLKDYNRYCFKPGYDKAILRSKNFKNITGSMFIYKLYITSPEYSLNMFNYDYKNYYTLSDFSQYKDYEYDKDYYRYNLEVNEDDNIFPVLYNRLQKDDICFYLSNNMFVQFYNMDDSNNSIINGIDDDYFHENNDVILPSEDEDFIYYSNKSFFSMFTTAFNYFKDSIISIFQDVTYFWNHLPVPLVNFFVLAFSFIIILVFVRFLL